MMTWLPSKTVTHGTFLYVSLKIPLYKQNQLESKRFNFNFNETAISSTCVNSKFRGVYLLEGELAVSEDEGTRLDHYDAVHFVWHMGEELLHCILVASLLKVHVCLETLNVSIQVWALEQHPQVLDSALVALSNIDTDTPVFFLLDGDLSSSLFGHEDQIWLGDSQLLIIEVRSDPDVSIAITRLDGSLDAGLNVHG